MGRFLKQAILIFWFVLLALSSQAADKPPPIEITSAERSVADDKRGTDDQPFAVKIVPTAEQQSDSADQKADRKAQVADERELVADTGYQILIGYIQAAIFALQLVAFVVQAIYLRRTVFEMRRANKSAEDALIAGERPWVGVQSVGLDNIAATQKPKIVLITTNSGKTPAIKNGGTFNAVVRDAHQEPPPIPGELVVGAGYGVLMPGGQFEYHPFELHDPLSAEQVERIKDGRDKLWVVGRLEYLDGRGHKHVTTVHTYYSPARHSFLTSANGNHAD